MQIILWRHAQAEDGKHDLMRALTPKGQQQAKKMASKLKKMLPENTQVWVSEAIRSRETAAYLNRNMETFAALNPETAPQQVLDLLLQQLDDDTVVIVGHQPWLGKICAFLLNQNWQSASPWSVKKGAYWWFQAQREHDIFHCKLKHMHTP
ncbi:MAG: histidine phosphatase family protein [Alysiella sp.]|uniref:SixA phosphatase family protein n=1 Tax=Alysiella sp. TaxID=1872483 RepID=UPI0026DBEF9C|nr:histidine phosphatase family protein [Alysiella sp.]MDO4434437.1 histidine phosphatase family protein [Alysiella sp.]